MSTEQCLEMEPDMSSSFPSGIRALIVDDDARFLKSASMLLSLQNFKVATCESSRSALKLLTSKKLKGADIVHTNAQKVADCGFDFRAIIEPDLRIPVLYYAVLPQDNKSVGDEADELFRTLQAATYIIKKPLNTDEVHRLWRISVCQKCFLDTKASGRVLIDAGGSCSSTLTTLDGGKGNGTRETPFLICSSDDEGGEEEHIKFKALKRRRGQKRKARNPSGSDSGTGHDGSNSLGNHPAKTLRKDHAASHPELDKKSNKNDDGNASKRQQPQAIDGEPHQPGPQESLFVHSVLKTLDVPSYNPKIFADATGPSSHKVAAFAGASNSAAPAPAQAPASPPVYQQQQRPAGNVFINNIISFSSGAPAPAPPAPASPPVYQQQQRPAGTVFVNNIISFASGANAAAPAPAPPAPASPPVYYLQQLADNVSNNIIPFASGAKAAAPAPAPAPTSHPVHRQQQPAGNTTALTPAPELSPAYQQQQQSAGNVFSNIASFATGSIAVPAPALLPVYQHQQPAASSIAPLAATTTMSTVVTSQHQFSLGDHQQQVVDSPSLMFGPFPYQGPPLPVMQQDMFAPRGSGRPRRETWNFQLPFQQPPAAGDLLVGMTGGGTIGAAAATPHARAFGNNTTAGSLMPSFNLGAPQDADEFAAMVATYTRDDPTPMKPNQVGVAATEAEMAALNTSEDAGSLAAPQVPGMPCDVNNPTMAGAVGSNIAESFVAPSGNQQLAVGTWDNSNGSLVGSGAVANGDAHFAAMGTPDNGEFSFTLEELLGLDEVPMYDAGLGVQLGSATDGATAAATGNAAGTSLNGGEGGMEKWDMSVTNVNGIFDDIFSESTGPFLLLNDMNNGN